MAVGHARYIIMLSQRLSLTSITYGGKGRKGEGTKVKDSEREKTGIEIHTSTCAVGPKKALRTNGVAGCFIVKEKITSTSRTGAHTLLALCAAHDETFLDIIKN